MLQVWSIQIFFPWMEVLCSLKKTACYLYIYIGPRVSEICFQHLCVLWPWTPSTELCDISRTSFGRPPLLSPVGHIFMAYIGHICIYIYAVYAACRAYVGHVDFGWSQGTFGDLVHHLPFDSWVIFRDYEAETREAVICCDADLTWFNMSVSMCVSPCHRMSPTKLTLFLHWNIKWKSHCFPR